MQIKKVQIDPIIEQMTDTQLKITGIYYPGDYGHEHVVIDVNYDCNLSDYLLFRIVRKANDLPDYGQCRVLTFDDTDLKAGDQVYIMTCCGDDKKRKGPKGSTIHVVYWNLLSPVWSDGENEVMFMERGDSTSAYLKASSSKEN